MSLSRNKWPFAGALVAAMLAFAPARAANPTLGVGEGGTGAATAPSARANLGAAASGANTDITSLANLPSILGVLPACTPGSSVAPVAAGQAFQCGGLILIAQ